MAGKDSKLMTIDQKPWYRQPGYDGNLTEAEKLQLDGFRALSKHPATQYENLPEEVQDYISKIEIELYDAKQAAAAGGMFAGAGAGVALLWLCYFGYAPAVTLWDYAISAMVIVASLVWYRWKWGKNSTALSALSADEKLKMEWELNHVVNQKTGQSGGPD